MQQTVLLSRGNIFGFHFLYKLKCVENHEALFFSIWQHTVIRQNVTFAAAQQIRVSLLHILNKSTVGG
jgi:hypothetical protein